MPHPIGCWFSTAGNVWLWSVSFRNSREKVFDNMRWCRQSANWRCYDNGIIGKLMWYGKLGEEYVSVGEHGDGELSVLLNGMCSYKTG